MATVTGFTAERMLVIENTTVVDGHIAGDDLILETREGTEINAGSVRGPVGPMGPAATDFQPGDLVTSMRTAKTGFLLCNGASYLRSAYAALFNEIGTMFGSVDSTHFNVPDYRDKAAFGASTAKPLGSSGGEATHLLTAAEMPSHNHGSTGIESVGHQHAVKGTVSNVADHAHAVPGPSGFQYVINVGSSPFFVSVGAAGDHGGAAVTFSPAPLTGPGGAHYHNIDNGYTEGALSASHSHPTNNAGGGAAHNIIPPYIAANVFIKT